MLVILNSSLKQVNSKSTPNESVNLWLENNLIPNGLDEASENAYKMFSEHYDLLRPYIKLDEAKLYFDKKAFCQERKICIRIL